MSKKNKSLLYNFICFALLFVLTRILIMRFTGLNGFWIPLTAFVVSTIIAPKFQSIATPDGEKIAMKWIFIKGIKYLN